MRLTATAPLPLAAAQQQTTALPPWLLAALAVGAAVAWVDRRRHT